MRRLTLLTTVTEGTLLVLTAALVLALHLGGLVAPMWLVRAIPLGEDLQQLLPAAQLILLTGWIVLGPGPLWVRLPAAPVLLLLWAMGWTGSAGQGVETTGTWLLAAGVAAAIAALGIRCCGLRLAMDKSPFGAARRHPQFSIKGLIILTTLIAVGLGILEWLRPGLRTDSELSVYLEKMLIARLESEPLAGVFSAVNMRQFVLGGALAVTSLSALWCVLRPGALWLRLLAAAVFAPLLGVYLANLTGNDWQASINLAIGLTELAAVVGISVVPLRLASVQLVRPRSTGFQPVPSTTNHGRLKTCPTEFVPETVS
jgi:hypothetical protein